jgi:hypothetical protein
MECRNIQEAHVHNFFRTFTGIAAVAAIGAALTVSAPRVARAQAPAAQAQQPKKKNLKDTGEYDIYNEVIKDVTANNFSKALTDLDSWKQKYPDSEYKDERSYFYMSAYNGMNQPGKVLDTAGPLLATDIKSSLDSKTVLQVLYIAALNAAKISASNSPVQPTAEELATGQKAAQELLDYTKSYFASDKKPANVSDADWNKGRTDLETVGRAALVSMAMQPGNQAMKEYATSKDASKCAAAESAYTKALQQYPDAPDSAQISYALAGALGCQQKADPTKVPQAVYEYARAAALEPGKGGFSDPKVRQQVHDYLAKVYTSVHGSDEGLDQLKQTALASPLPPAGFKIETANEIATRKENEFKEKYPQLAMWMGIKRQLTDTNGDQYFEGQLKNAAVPKLKGTLMDAKPACRSKELLVAVPEPDQKGTLQAEITLKLDAPLKGKPETGTEIQWEGVPSAFSREPFMLTMDTEQAKIEGLKVSPCTAAAPATKKGATKKGPVRKKK